MKVRLANTAFSNGWLLLFFFAVIGTARLTAAPENATNTAAPVAELSPLELQAKAAFVYNFAKFTTWPTNTLASATSPIVIGVLGEDKLEAVLRKIIAGKHFDQHALEVKFCQTLEDIHGCHLLYLNRWEYKHRPSILRLLADRPVLTISDAENFIEDGGMLEIDAPEGKAVRFSANIPASQRAGLQISSKLLLLAQWVIRAPNGKRETPQ